MNFTITRQNLHNGIAAVSASIPSKTTLPVLSNILFEAREDGVWMSGTDLDVAVRVRVPADVKEAGSLTAPGKKLQEITRELPDQPVEVNTRGDQIELRCGRSHFKFNGLPADEFPALPQIHFEDGWTVNGKDLQRLIHHTSFAVSTEESRPILNGVLWELRDGSMRMVATNGHRLARMGIPAAAGGIASADFIVPPAALQHVQRLLKADEVVQVARNGNHLGFRSGATEVFSRLIEGTYPNYEQVIPKDNPRELIVSRTDLIEAVDIVASHADTSTQQIRFSLRGGKFSVSSATADFGAGEQSVEAEYKGEDMEIGYNARYLLQILRSIPTERVVVRLKTALSAGVLEPVGAPPQADEKLLCLIMPLRLPDAVG